MEEGNSREEGRGTKNEVRNTKDEKGQGSNQGPCYEGRMTKDDVRNTKYDSVQIKTQATMDERRCTKYEVRRTKNETPYKLITYKTYLAFFPWF